MHVKKWQCFQLAISSLFKQFIFLVFFEYGINFFSIIKQVAKVDNTAKWKQKKVEFIFRKGDTYFIIIRESRFTTFT